jgi:hypothetical protein
MRIGCAVVGLILFGFVVIPTTLTESHCLAFHPNHESSELLFSEFLVELLGRISERTSLLREL